MVAWPKRFQYSWRKKRALISSINVTRVHSETRPQICFSCILALDECKYIIGLCEDSCLNITSKPRENSTVAFFLSQVVACDTLNEHFFPYLEINYKSNHQIDYTRVKLLFENLTTALGKSWPDTDYEYLHALHRVRLHEVIVNI